MFRVSELKNTNKTNESSRNEKLTEKYNIFNSFWKNFS